MKLFAIILTAMLLASANAVAQNSYSINDLYQYNYTTVSPALAGVDGEKMTFMGSVVAWKSGGTTGLGFIGYETPIKKINSGIGFNLNTSQQTTNTVSNLNFLYNYQLELDDERKLVFGVRLGLNQFSMVRPQTLPPGIFDPDLLVYDGLAANTFMTTAGVLYKHKKFFASLSVDNLIRDTYELHGFVVFRGFYDKQYNLVIGRDFRIAEKLSSTHSAFIVKVDDFWRFDINNSFVFNNWLIAGASLEVNNSDSDNQIFPKANAGFNVKNKAKFIFSAYSEAYNTGGTKFRGQMMMLFNL